jgi:hypothetical protein
MVRWQGNNDKGPIRILAQRLPRADKLRKVPFPQPARSNYRPRIRLLIIPHFEAPPILRCKQRYAAAAKASRRAVPALDALAVGRRNLESTAPKPVTISS